MFRQAHRLVTAISGILPRRLREPGWTSEVELMREHVRADERANLNVVTLVRAHERRPWIRVRNVRIDCERGLVIESVREILELSESPRNRFVVIVNRLRTRDRIHVSGADESRPHLAKLRKHCRIHGVSRIAPALVPGRIRRASRSLVVCKL